MFSSYRSFPFLHSSTVSVPNHTLCSVSSPSCLIVFHPDSGTGIRDEENLDSSTNGSIVRQLRTDQLLMLEHN